MLAEVLAGVVYSQMIHPGAPAIFGAFVTSIDFPRFGFKPSSSRRHRFSANAMSS